MYIYKLPNAAASTISVTSTATSLIDLIETAASTTVSNLVQGSNAFDIKVEGGDVRALMDTNTPTASNGFLLEGGGYYTFRGVPFTQVKLIRVGGSDVSCSVQVGRSDESEGSGLTASTPDTLATKTIAGEDLTNGLTAVLPKPIAESTYAPTLFTDFGANLTVNVKASKGNVLRAVVENTTATPFYWQLHDTATTPGVAAVPKFPGILIPANQQVTVGKEVFGDTGVHFSNGIATAYSTGARTYVTIGAATDQNTTILYV